jgi:hypothetical protein
MTLWKNNIPKWLSLIERFTPWLENEEDLTKEIEESDILPWSKKFLLEKLEKYSNNDKDNSKNDLNSEEIKKIRELINEYNIIENKYQEFREKLKTNYSNLIKKHKGQLKTKIEKNKYTSEIDEKEKYRKDIDSVILTITKKILHINETPNSDILKNLYIKMAEEYLNNTKKYEVIKWDYELISKLLENIEINSEQLKEFWNLWLVIKGSKKTIYLKQILSKYKKYTKKLKIEWLEEENKAVFLYWIKKYLLNKTVVLGRKRFKFTKEFIEKNKEKFMKNIKAFLIFLMNIESYWGEIYIENKKSSAKWPIQWIDWFKNWIKYKSFSRKGKNARYTPFETALRRTDKFYNNWKYTGFKSDNTPSYIKNAWNNNWKLDLIKFWPEKQISLWFTDVIMRSSTIKRKGNRKINIKPREYLMWVLLWHPWSAKKIYENVHHTKSAIWSKTKALVNKEIRRIFNTKYNFKTYT